MSIGRPVHFLLIVYSALFPPKGMKRVVVRGFSLSTQHSRRKIGASSLMLRSTTRAPSRSLSIYASTNPFVSVRTRGWRPCSRLCMSTETSPTEHRQNDTASETAAPKKRRGRRSKKPVEKLFRADRVLANRMTDMSRSECFQLLKERRVYQASADGRFHTIKGPSHRLPMNAQLRIDNTIVPQLPPLLYVYHKPKWVLSVTSDSHKQRKCLDNTIVPPFMHPVGRLDYDTSGLLLFSSSGALTQRLLHPKHEIRKHYQAVVTGVVDCSRLRQQLEAGVTTGAGVHAAELVECQHWEPEKVASYLRDVRSGLPPEYNQTDLKIRGYLDVFDASDLTTVELIVAEGKHRMVRRMLANCGHPVVSLKRLRFGQIGIEFEGGELAEGSMRELTAEEIAWAESLLPEDKAKKKYRKPTKQKP